MNRLSKLTLATLLGASTLSGCTKPYQQLPKGEVLHVVGVPVSRVERSQAADATTGSYTFFLDVSSPENLRGLRCAYRTSGDLGIDDVNNGVALRNQRLEYETLFLEMRREQRTPVGFDVSWFTADKCVVISSQPEDFKPQYK
ncbi:TPA: hypothetical protein HA251_02150 [Candidatus Woesearchaeota archaeon]|nr:hypothetical protein [Candidatus Woesearchaeota archaeon]